MVYCATNQDGTCAYSVGCETSESFVNFGGFQRDAFLFIGHFTPIRRKFSLQYRFTLQFESVGCILHNKNVSQALWKVLKRKPTLSTNTIYFAAAAAEVCTYIALRDNAAALSGVVRRGGKPLRGTFGYFSGNRKVTRVRADSPRGCI